MTPEQVLERLGRAALEDDLPIRAADAIDDATDTIKDMVAEIGRLRAIVRVNCIRWGGTDAEVDRLLAVPNGER